MHAAGHTSASSRLTGPLPGTSLGWQAGAGARPDPADKPALSESDRIWEKRLRDMLTSGSLTLLSQPILNLHNNRISRYLLVPFLPSEEGNTIQLSEGFPAAERLGLLPAVHREMLRQALQLTARFRQESPHIRLEIGLGDGAPADEELTGWMQTQLKAAGVRQTNLILNMRERAVSAAGSQATGFISELRSLGNEFALDDFGTAGWSFYSLEHAPVDYVKIVGGCISRLPHSKSDQDLVRRLVKVADRCGVRVVAKSADTRELVHLVRQYGVDEAEGSSIGQPGVWHKV